MTRLLTRNAKRYVITVMIAAIFRKLCFERDRKLHFDKTAFSASLSRILLQVARLTLLNIWKHHLNKRAHTCLGTDTTSHIQCITLFFIYLCPGCLATYSWTGDRSTYSSGALTHRTVAGRKVDAQHLLDIQWRSDLP